MKILVVSNMFPNHKYPSYGVFVKKFCDQLEKIGIEYDKSIMHKSQSKLGKIFGYFSFYVDAFFKILLGQYNIVYVHYASHSGIPVMIASVFRRIKIYTNVHGSDVIPESKKKEKMQKYTKWLVENSIKVIVPSEYFRDVVSEKCQIDREKIYIYPSGGIDPQMFYPYSRNERARFRHEYGIDNENVVFGFAGRICAGKGWDTFIEAAAKLEESHIEANYIIVGEGPEEKKMNDLLVSKGLQEKVKRIGLLPQNQLAAFYNILDYFVFPTTRLQESLGLVAVEAMACGIPVIASSFAAPDYYVKNGYNGFKFEVGETVDLVKKMIDGIAILHKNQFVKMQQNALNTASNYYEKNIIDSLKYILDA